MSSSPNQKMTTPRDNVHGEQLEDPVGPEYRGYFPEGTPIAGAHTVDENQEMRSPYDTDEDREDRYRYDENGELCFTGVEEGLEGPASERVERKGRSHQRMKRGGGKERSESTKRAEKEEFDRKGRESREKNEELRREARERRKKGKGRKA